MVQMRRSRRGHGGKKRQKRRVEAQENDGGEIAEYRGEITGKRREIGREGRVVDMAGLGVGVEDYDVAFIHSFLPLCQLAATYTVLFRLLLSLCGLRLPPLCL